ERLGQAAFEAAEDRTPAGCETHESERVVRDADERRGEYREERLVVVAVVQEPQVGEQVDDLLLAEVAASSCAVGRQPGTAQLLLVPLGVGSRSEEEHDLAGRRCARVDQLPYTTSDRPRLAATPVDAAPVVARLVGDEQ